MWIITIIETIGYIGIAGAMFLETYIPIVQSEIVMPFSGYASVKGELEIWQVIIAGIIGSELGAISLYLLARLLERKRVLAYISKYGVWLGYNKDDFNKADKWLEKHQRSSVFIGRFIPGIRSAVAIPAGIQKMNMWEFALLNLFGVSVWVSALALAGYYLADQYTVLSQYSSYITYGIIIFVVSFVAYRLLKVKFKS